MTALLNERPNWRQCDEQLSAKKRDIKILLGVVEGDRARIH